MILILKNVISVFRYIITLKGEIAAAHANSSTAPTRHESSSREDDRQTILKMKRIIEQLSNKLKKVEGSKSSKSSQSSSGESQRKSELLELTQLKSDHDKLQKNFHELLRKISILEVENELAQSQAINFSCPHCNQNLAEMATQDADVLSQQLQQKISLLDRAKSLLARSVCTEKHLRIKIAELKKRICELEGVPAISEENSDASQI